MNPIPKHICMISMARDSIERAYCRHHYWLMTLSRRLDAIRQRVTLENQIRGLALVFGVRLPRGLSPAFAEQVTSASGEVPALLGALRGLLVARDALLGAITAINRDTKRLARSSEACQRLMTIPGVGHLTALGFVAAIDEPDRFRSSRDVGPYLGLVPRRWKSGEIDYTGSISKVGDRRLRTLLYEGANIMLSRYRGDLALKDWALRIGKRSTMRKARVALARRLAIIMPRHASGQHRLPDRVELSLNERRGRDKLPSGVLPRKGIGDGADSVACGRSDRPTAVATKPPRTQLTPSSAIEHEENGVPIGIVQIAQEPSSRPL
jgi:Transposase IS116/IS110/IS902 family